MNNNKQKNIRIIARIILSILGAFSLIIITAAIYNITLITKYPKTYLGTTLLMTSSLTFFICYIRKSYKYLNDFILALSAGVIAFIYLLTGSKELTILPPADLLEKDELAFFLIMLNFILVANSLISKIFLTVYDFFKERKTEQKTFHKLNFTKRVILFFRRFPFNKKIKQ
ncbi:hypothetical protein O8H66_000940 [Yersinia ruckeri]|uniref:hypothetical protein n=1 Tax=Enterobacterales TaxID=91347 RepID=UPI000A4FDAD2|nr:MULTISPECIES: hypothetical protein [Enterobacterales]EKN3361116.1 hypothetical protein [Yersinia ruckeri]EKN4202359.1 hypothetical protein [Yersinia ruckeri]EKN4724973.1 hypothetical protein [Yersinia ruckeri]MBO1588487.1 hypothetical protein [Yersinia pseudotuberculosis]TBL50277.1 hypothetical protein EYZ00_20775 [Hafnia paralvei]